MPRMKSIYYFMICIIITLRGQFLVGMPSDLQLVTYSLLLDEDFIVIDGELHNLWSDQYIGFAYGVCSYYSPLSQIAQTGSFGLFDSSCYNLINVIHQKKNINFLYYDCLDNQLITKNIRFKDDNGVEYFYSIPIDIENYQNNWYYFQIIVLPSINLVQIIVQQLNQQIFFEELKIKFPFAEKILTLNIGGGVDSHYFSEKIKFSYFPGYMLKFPLISYNYDPEKNYKIILDSEVLLPFFECHSLNFMNTNTLGKTNSINYFSTQYPHIGSYQLQGWIKILKVVDGGKSFSKKLLKLTTQSLNSKLTNDNLSPFCLIYYFSDQGNQIIFTTYSYTFPYVNIDYTNNPNLIIWKFDIKSNIMLWHYLKVVQQDNILQVTITFYDEIHTQFEKQITVTQFKRVVFQLQIGNIEGVEENYLEFVTAQFYFSNCVTDELFPACDNSCLDCNGPTSKDCLSCSLESNRYYQPELQQCNCQFDSVDVQQCQNHQDLNFNILSNDSINDLKSKCSFGYFEIEQECFVCPSIINSQQITCLECLTNPSDWINLLYCSTSLISISGETFQTITEAKQYFLFDGIQINYCQYCTDICSDQECINNHFNYVNSPKILLCSDSNNPNCYQFTLKYCIKNYLQLNGGLVCIFCDWGSKLINGKCFFMVNLGDNKCDDENCAYCQRNQCQICFAPYYLTSDLSQCKLCNIKNCQYCFEFQTTDRTISTLYMDFYAFQRDEYTSLGCSLCQEGYNYNFNSGECIYGAPKINNCLRSYIDYSEEEVCLVSAINDFNVAPQIINCQLYITNCEQCILTPAEIIKCIICSSGYSASFKTGQCEQCNIQYAINCIDGIYLRYDYWAQLIQSFLIQFLPDKYIYNFFSTYLESQQFPLSCEKNYKLTRNGQCAKYCETDCEQCIEKNRKEFVCKQCPVSYYGLTGFSVSQGNCLNCPQLCSICHLRTQEEIYVIFVLFQKINPDFIVQSSNALYTYKCFQAVPDDKVIINANTQIAKYCFDKNCLGQFEYQVLFSYEPQDNCMPSLASDLPYFYEDSVNFDYCNRMGIQFFQLYVEFFCHDSSSQRKVESFIKKSVFSLQKTKFLFVGSDQVRNDIWESFTIQNFDLIEWQYITYTGTSLKLLNNNRPIDLIISNSIFSGTINDIDLFMQNSLFNNLQMKNILLVDLHLTNLIWVDYYTSNDQTLITIDELTIQNCIFENVTLFSIHQLTGIISINKLNIIESQLIQTIILKYNSTNQYNESCNINSFIIKDSTLKNSTLLFHNGGQLFIRDLFIKNCALNNSVLIMAQCSTILDSISLVKINLTSSFFLKADIQESFFTKVNYVLNNFLIRDVSFFTNSLLIYINELKTKEIQISIDINNFNHSNLVNQGDSNQQLFIYELQGYQLSIKEFYVFNSSSLSYLNIKQTEIIKITNIIYKNDIQQQKVLPKYECYSDINSISTLLRIQGYFSILLQRIDIINQFSVDHSLIEIISDQFFYSGTELIQINSIKFQGNILIKKQLANVFSLLVIYSDRIQNIVLKDIKFEENFFNQLIDDPSQTTASLIFVNSQLSTVQCSQIYCLNNGLTNSSFSFIFANSLSINIDNFIVQNSNLLTNKLWSKYYQINTQNNINITNSLAEKLIGQIFGISNVGGVAKIISSQIYLNFANFTNIIAGSRSIFDITTYGQGKIFLNNLIIENIQSALELNMIADGCITIFSQNSILQLYATNIWFKEIFNRLDSALFTIYSSKKSNYLQFFNVSVLDCFSLMNQFILAEFSKESISHIQFNNITVNNSEFGLNNYLQLINFPSSLEIIKIKSENALFNLINCDVTFVNIFITGVFVSPIFIIGDSQINIVNNMRIQNIKLLYPFSLLQFTKITQIKSTLIIENLEIINAIQIFKSELDISDLYSNQYSLQSFQNCFFEQINITQLKVNKTIEALIASLNYEVVPIGSLMQIKGLSQFAKVQIKKVNILSNICNFCYDGIVTIQSTQLSKIIFEDFRCISNNINSFGCLQLKSLENQVLSKQRFLIKQSSFLKNNGTSGVGLFSQNILFILANSIFIGNIASENGGAIYIQDAYNEFLIRNCFIIENSALIGGGIYLSGQSSIRKENFQQSLNLFNKVIQQSNNLMEAPDHLTLSINNYEIKSTTILKNNLTSQIISIESYFLRKKMKIYTTYLYLPSGQEISNFKLYDEKNRVFIPYINEISVAFKNSLNEELIGDNLDECSIYTNDINGVESGLEYLKLGNIKFNSTLNKFDIGGIKISFNPYINPNQYLIIQIKCTSNIGKKQLNYQINAKTFNCQLGEFFSNNQCLICEPSFGFYSVTLGATQCSIFDETKFEKITSNQIKLKPSFWRSTYTSNSVELCLKNQQYCQGGWGVGNELCYTGHIGGLCEECDTQNIRGDGQYVKTATLECGACSGSYIQKLPFIMLVIWSFISMLLTLKSNKNTSKTFAKLRVTTQLYEILFKLTQNFESILFKMFLNYLWIFSAIFTFNITFDFSLSAVDSISTPSASVASNLDCELSEISGSQLIYVRLIGMFIFILFQILVVSCGLKIYSLLTESPFEYSIITNSLLYLFISNQSAIIKSLSSLIAVRTISEKEYIQGNVSLEFYKDQHIQWILYFILPCLLIFAVIIPLTLFLILFFNKQQFNQVNFRKHLGYLFNEYNKENQFWEQTRTLQRTIIIIFLTTFETNVYLKACLISLTVLFYQVLSQIRQPYIIKSLNRLDIESGQLIQIAIFSALIKYISEQNNNTLSSGIFQIIIILLMLQLCQSFIIRIITLYFKKYYFQTLLLLKNISLKLGNVTFVSNFLQEKCRELQMRKQKLELNFDKLRSINSKSLKQERKEAWATTSKFYVQSKYQLFIPKSQK